MHLDGFWTNGYVDQPNKNSVGLMGPLPKFGTGRIFANFFLTKNYKLSELALVQVDPALKQPSLLLK